MIPNLILPGYLAGAKDYLGLQMSLENLGFKATIVPLEWWEWLPTVGGRSIAPILLKLDQAVKQICQELQVSQVNLIAHSAGGWVSRIYLGETPYYGRVWGANAQVARLISLGTPHRSKEPWAAPNLDFVNNNYPDAFHQNLKYICIAGKAVYGEKTWKSWLAYSSYELTCGIGNTWGDGIIPIECAHLAGAENLVLEGANHSPKAGLWYGSPELVHKWASYLEP
ncbi:PGAP1-like protein [Synechococcus sp. PCC 7502]|uniref:esterase/lipase family protein n=1 Tax=Synechococcus sp. PCC 7502 TaxID=1173263 RepID=UPI00029F9EAC|nr:PGAP1-like protein [Synechococcus sp. PCC 7502]AFY75303.1 PGAP1-like protein [Synechococcus sp. PCC 7502]